VQSAANLLQKFNRVHDHAACALQHGSTMMMAAIFIGAFRQQMFQFLDATRCGRILRASGPTGQR